MSAPVSRPEILAAARTWIGTPYVHQASCKGAGCDCLGLLRGVWRDLYGTEPEAPPAYTPDWAERHRAETLRDAAARHLVPIAVEEAGAGDVLLFAFKPELPAKHCALLTISINDPAAKILHAHENLPVAEVALFDGWRRRVRFAFQFPNLADPAPGAAPALSRGHFSAGSGTTVGTGPGARPGLQGTAHGLGKTPVRRN